MATLPRRRTGRGRVGAGVRTGTAADVPQVRRTQDPGLTVPRGVFDESSTAIGESLQQLGVIIAQKDEGEQNLINQNQFNEATLRYLDFRSDLENTFSTDENFRTLSERTTDQLNLTVLNLSETIQDEATRNKFMTASYKNSIETLAKARATTKIKEKDLALSTGIGFEDNVLKKFVENPNYTPQTEISGIESVEGYYWDLAKGGTIDRVSAHTKIRTFRAKAGQIKFQQDLRFLNDKGTPEDFVTVEKNLRANTYHFPPEDVEDKIDVMTRDYNLSKDRSDKAAETERKLVQAENYTDRLLRLPGKNESLDENGQLPPNYTYQEYREDVKFRRIAPRDQPALLTGLRKAHTEQVEGLIDDLQLFVADAEITIARRIGDPLKVETALIQQRQLSHVPGESATAFNRAMNDIRLWKKDLESETGVEMSRQIAEVNTRIAAIDRAPGLNFDILSDPQAEEKELIRDLQGLAAARIRDGENYLTVQEDILTRVVKEGGLFSSGRTFKLREEDIAAAKDTLLNINLVSPAEADVARRRLILDRRLATLKSKREERAKEFQEDAEEGSQRK
ncbi:hypothetical protein KAR91_44820 [Candidatus Pacearchaeota archaeon]|nr:hypothetical protein [Candidatus Pacearchaeota archaeon]